MSYCRCRCFCCAKRFCIRWIPPEQGGEVESEEREKLHEPADQISLSSTNSVEPDDDDDDNHRTTETVV